MVCPPVSARPLQVPTAAPARSTLAMALTNLNVDSGRLTLADRHFLRLPVGSLSSTTPYRTQASDLLSRQVRLDLASATHVAFRQYRLLPGREDSDPFSSVFFQSDTLPAFNEAFIELLAGLRKEVQIAQ